MKSPIWPASSFQVGPRVPHGNGKCRRQQSGTITVRVAFHMNSKRRAKLWATAWQNQQNPLCAQQGLRSAWASAQSEQSLRSPHEETLGPKLPIECTAKTLIRLGGCPGWSESSLGPTVILLVLLWCGSVVFVYLHSLLGMSDQYGF